MTLTDHPAEDLQWNPETTLPVVKKALADHGLEPREMRLMRFTENCSWELVGLNMMARITRPYIPADSVTNEIKVVRALAERDYSSTRLVEKPEQPIDTSMGKVTVWQWVDARPGKGQDVPHIGTCLRDLHAQDWGSDFLTWDPLRRIPNRIAGIRSHSHYPSTLIDRIEAIYWDVYGEFHAYIDNLSAAEKPHAPSPRSNNESPDGTMGWGLVHGDAYEGNVMVRPDGTPLLCDWEYACYGPYEWDLNQVILKYMRYGRDERTYETFQEKYGYEFQNSPILDLVVKLSEIANLTCIAQSYNNPLTLGQIELRTLSIEKNDYDLIWTIF